MIDKIKLKNQREDEEYNLGKNRQIGDIRFVESCGKNENEKVISTCPICSGRLKHNNSSKEGITCRCRLCDFEFLIKINYWGDLIKKASFKGESKQ